MSLISEQFKLAVLRNAVFVGVVGIVLLLAGGLAALYLGSSIGFLMIGAAVFGGFYGGAMLLDVGEKSGREKYEVSLVDRMLATRSSGGGLLRLSRLMISRRKILTAIHSRRSISKPQ